MKNLPNAEVTEIIFKGDESQTAIFAGGCFWCMEPPFEKLTGVKEVISGYSGGNEANPEYKLVASGMTTHAESVLVKFDSNVTSYEKLLEVFWHNINPTQKDGQFYDHGSQYRTAIFYTNAEQKKLAEKSKEALSNSAKFSEPIVTQIEAAGRFWKAEEVHQDYYKKSPDHYKRYRVGSGRDAYLKKTWKEK